ncbi:uncharacterized protein FFB20_13539 [Fusarium fujikuroi]|nr:uncharacterized protein FFC1_06045 [Fusarium fujikuroi]SCN97063.1 uncharacterized protein FFM5_06571 [Fusarium fujikuroi]SCO00869.1 uncharacterized protein FFE2_09607 [Fusarium fujikuroi]SCO10445.1 uncharacterized protein FFB20_13539 [Fusarium fujikuroi]SCO38323.1 uncharacterized protein FFNC_06167 [Fusarium fujikuroi]
MSQTMAKATVLQTFCTKCSVKRTFEINEYLTVGSLMILTIFRLIRNAIYPLVNTTVRECIAIPLFPRC